jgi:catechol-2,3-dioxygenase
VRHYAFSVGSEAESVAWRAKLATAGAQFWEEDHGDQRSIYVADPNGIVLEITTPPSAALQVADPAALAKARAWIADAAALTP